MFVRLTVPDKYRVSSFVWLFSVCNGNFQIIPVTCVIFWELFRIKTLSTLLDCTPFLQIWLVAQWNLVIFLLGLFKPGFPKLLRFQDHHDKVLRKTMKGLAKHLETEGVSTSLYSLKWFMQCFLDRVSENRLQVPLVSEAFIRIMKIWKLFTNYFAYRLGT